MKFIESNRISPHRSEDNSGYLICRDAILARTGQQDYAKAEIFPDSGDWDTVLHVQRDPRDVFDPKALASFENKPVTIEHPDEDVNSENYGQYAVGYVRDIHQGRSEDGSPVVMGTLVITNKDAINQIENGDYVYLSCGYECDFDGDEGHLMQRNIRGNHIALCKEPRAGKVAHIRDSNSARKAAKDSECGQPVERNAIKIRLGYHNLSNGAIKFDEVYGLAMKETTPMAIKMLKNTLEAMYIDAYYDAQQNYESDIANAACERYERALQLANDFRAKRADVLSGDDKQDIDDYISKTEAMVDEIKSKSVPSTLNQQLKEKIDNYKDVSINPADEAEGKKAPEAAEQEAAEEEAASVGEPAAREAKEGDSLDGAEERYVVIGAKDKGDAVRMAVKARKP